MDSVVAREPPFRGLPAADGGDAEVPGPRGVQYGRPRARMVRFHWKVTDYNIDNGTIWTPTCPYGTPRGAVVNGNGVIGGVRRGRIMLTIHTFHYGQHIIDMTHL